jgi:hypothetical protein
MLTEGEEIPFIFNKSLDDGDLANISVSISVFGMLSDEGIRSGHFNDGAKWD